MIKQLIKDLAYDNVTLNQGLTRAKIIAYEINNKIFQEWLKKELEGYKVGDLDVPDYRKIPCIFKVTISNGYNQKTLPVLFGDNKELDSILSHHQSLHSISALEENLSMLENKGFIDFPISGVKDLEKILEIQVNGARIIGAGQEFNKIQLRNIIDLTKQKLLDTLLELDKEIPNLTDNLTMSKDKNDKIQNIVTNNIYGNNNPLNIATGVTVSQQDVNFKIDDVNLSDLEKYGVNKEEIEVLRAILNNNKNDKVTLQSKTMKWLGSVTASVAGRGLYEHIPAITDFVSQYL